ncbi:MAG: ArsR family transcriptional regulator [Nitrosopumilus sp. H13]|nr:MAG: ArsR family transcriptional regulator [Nitrosopumilus sp. H13]
MSADEPAGDLEEKIRIMATDDEKIKSFGEVLTNDSSREILQLLFNDRLSAAQIAQKTGISLQLARYHLNKLQDLGVVKISRIEKNSKSQDMKIYSATKFSIVIVPPKLSEKTKKSKMLVMSFRHIYKVAGFGIAAGFSGLLSLSALSERQSAQPAIEPIPGPLDDSADQMVLKDEYQLSGSLQAEPATSDDGPIQSSIDHAVELQSRRIESEPAADTYLSDGTGGTMPQVSLDDRAYDFIANSEPALSADLFLPLAALTGVLAVLAGYYLWRLFKTRVPA